jgi:hypothetical protein
MRKTKHKQQNKIRGTRRQKGGALCSDDKDIFNLGNKMGDNYKFDNLAFSFFNVAENDRVYITKITCLSKQVSKFGKGYNDIYDFMKLINHMGTVGAGHSVVFSKICCDTDMRPIGYLVFEKSKGTHSGLVGGKLCKEGKEWTPGIQIGVTEQLGESEDPLHISKENPNAIIKKLTGSGDDYNDIADLYTRIYNEINITTKSGLLGVGPKILHSQICCDEDLNPVGYLVMERIQGSYVREDTIKERKAEIKGLIDTLYDNKIHHMDIHNRNILLGTTESVSESRIWIIDYGDAEITPDILPVGSRDHVVFVISDINPNDKMKPIYLN